MNNRQAGRRRGRGNNRAQSNNRNGYDHQNRVDNRARGNAAQMLEKYKGNEEEATLAVLDKKERQLDSILFLKSPHLSGQQKITSFFVRR